MKRGTRRHQCWRRRITRNGQRITTPEPPDLRPRDSNRLRSYCRLCVVVMCTCEQSGQLTSLLRYCGRSVIYLRLPALCAFLFRVWLNLQTLYTGRSNLFSLRFSIIIFFFFLVFCHEVSEFDPFLGTAVLSLDFSDLLLTYEEYCSYPHCSGSSIIADDMYCIPAMVSTHLFFLLAVRRSVVT